MKSIIITGANSGIGFECANHMARIAPNEQIILACRNIRSGEKAIEKIKHKTGHQHLICLPIDLASLQSIRDFKTAFNNLSNPVITALINNAGAIFNKLEYTENGFEKTFGTNHLGGFYLTLLLLPFMDKKGSITFTSSDTHDPDKKTGAPAPVYSTARALAFPNKKNKKTTIKVAQKRYATSKLCNVLTTYILHKKMTNTKIRVNAFDPGLTPGTRLTRGIPTPIRFFMQLYFRLLVHFRENTNLPKTSGSRLANLAYAKEFQNLNGIYFSNGKVIRSSKDSYNEDYQKDLWKTSIELTKIKRSDTCIELQ